MNRLVSAGLTGVAVSVIMAACSSGTTPVTLTVTSTVTRVVVADPESPPASPPPAPPAPSLKTRFGAGIYAVGTDIAAGTYSTNGSDTGCSYTFLPRKGAQLSEAEGGNTLFGPGYMELSEGQIVQTVGCSWTLVTN